ncbi:MAG: radical SAM protein [Eubacterium sp.]|nr:radical SAM protein [Eubacterium sp.]
MAKKAGCNKGEYMKKHAIIPVFIPHEGCPNDCVFCNQKIITAKSEPVTVEDVKNIAETYLSTLENMKVETIEMAFFGGSFTGIPIEKQSQYLEVAYDYKSKGIIDKIHLSTRPDYINREILDNLKKYSVDVIELGVQSFDPEVLALSKRGHTVDQVYEAVSLLKEYGFTFGIQLMIGLPGDTLEKSIESAKAAADLKPDLARLYPTVVLEDTELAQMYRNGSYPGLTEDEAVARCKEMYKILFDAGVNIMRVGLKSTDLVTNDSDLGGNYHPAFRQLVEGEIAKDVIENEIVKLLKISAENTSQEVLTLTIVAHPKSFNNMIGHKGANKKHFEEKYPQIQIKYVNDSALPIGKYKKI